MGFPITLWKSVMMRQAQRKERKIRTMRNSLSLKMWDQMEKRKRKPRRSVSIRRTEQGQPPLDQKHG